MDFSALTHFLDRMVGGLTPGNALEIYQNGACIYRHAAGYSNWENQTPMTGDELINIYSVSKLTTVTAAMQLLEQGAFLLEEPLYAFIPEYRDMQVRTPNGHLEQARSPITIRDLFSMTAGLDYNLQSPAIVEARKKTGGHMDTAAVAACLASQPLSFHPGEHWQYSLCHDVLAGLVSVITGQNFRDYVQEHIFDPLDMKDSYYHHTPQTLARTAEQYRYAPPSDCGNFDPVKDQFSRTKEMGSFQNMGKEVVGYRLGDEYDSGGAGITTTVSDYSKLLCALANLGTGINGVRVLSPASVELMRINRLGPVQQNDFDNFAAHLSGNGYGLGVRTHMKPAVSGVLSPVGEFGWDGAAGSFAMMSPEHNLAAFYVQHMLNPDYGYYHARLRNLVWAAL